jgi:hypothetical protein
MMIRHRGALAALLAALFLAGCADNAATEDAGAPASTSGTPGAQAAPSGPVNVPVDPSADPSANPGGKPAGQGTQTLTGTITAGVESGCLLLNGLAGPHLLIINDPAAKAVAQVGASVTVVGKSDPRVMTTCQQGVPFVVSQVRRN